MKKFIISILLFVSVPAISGEIDMLKDCKDLAIKLEKYNKNFPRINYSTITPLYTWRASTCETPPKGKGEVTALCDAQTNGGFNIFFWEKKNKNSFEPNFMTCE